MSRDLLRQLPAIDQWLASSTGEALCAEFSRDEVTDAMRRRLAALRHQLSGGRATVPDFFSEAYGAELRGDLLAGRRDTLVGCINATGIIVHTNLGRAPLAEPALEAIERVARGYSNLELDLETGIRGSRQAHVESMLTRLTGGEAALVVNNGAGALLMTLHVLAGDGDVVISRGELIEIGGSFRMPDVIAASGAGMVEVGTTNKTSVDDYEAAIGDETRALLASHPSNYRVIGFTAKPSLAELAALAHEHGLYLVQDLGSGSLVDLRAAGFADEPSVSDCLAAGVDVVTFSGDKLLGGPQAGIIAGRAEIVDRLRRHAAARALRIDKLSLAALAATLKLYLPPNDPFERIPVLRMMTETPDEVGRRARVLVERLAGNPAITAGVEDGTSFAGGGALPMHEIPSKVVRLTAAGSTVNELAARLRNGQPAVVARIANDAVIVDLRTVPADQLASLSEAILAAAR